MSNNFDQEILNVEKVTGRFTGAEKMSRGHTDKPGPNRLAGTEKMSWGRIDEPGLKN